MFHAKKLSRALFRALFLALLGLSAACSTALAVVLEKPIACQPGLDCFVQNYVDLSPGPEYADEACGSLTYDKHKGTDFRVPYERMREGVAVLAAAPGTVRGARDGMADVSVRQGGVEAVKDKECGNGLVLVHADGTETQYCHMRKGSLRVKTGDKVATGQELGLVGLSGQTEFPHLHFEVRVKGQAVCPFSGQVLEGGCAVEPKKPLWSEKALAAMPYVAGGGLEAGFSTTPPDLNALFVGDRKAETLTSDSPQLTYWAAFWGVRTGDRITMRVITPTGEVWSATPHVVPRNQAQLLLTIGKKRTIPWFPGTYRGEAALVRQGAGGTKSEVIPLSRRLTIAPSGPAVPAAAAPASAGAPAGSGN